MYERLIAIQSVMDKALRSFNRNEEYLISRRLCERCINGRFALHLQRAIDHSILKGYIVDVEWDRGMDGVEERKKQYENGDAYLDLVVHKREYDPEIGFDNLFVVEMKKQDLDFENDKRRLRTLTDISKKYGYFAGFAIRVDEVSCKLVIEDSYYLECSRERVLADQFRQALKNAASSLNSPLSHFPRGCCGEASIILAKWLHEHEWSHYQLGDIQYVCGIKRINGERISHAWLEIDGEIIDITGSQFEEYHIDTYVGPMDTFHKQFKVESKHPIIDHYDEYSERRFNHALQIIKEQIGVFTMKFYKLEDQIIISDKALTVGEEITANTTDGAFEKHVPVVTVSEDTVKVEIGSVEHPSLEDHYIEFVVLVTEGGMQMKWLKPGMKPEATFKITDKPVAAYEYCNLHGLWKAEA